jgi:hypothetical protein
MARALHWFAELKSTSQIGALNDLEPTERVPLRLGPEGSVDLHRPEHARPGIEAKSCGGSLMLLALATSRRQRARRFEPAGGFRHNRGSAVT